MDPRLTNLIRDERGAKDVRHEWNGRHEGDRPLDSRPADVEGYGPHLSEEEHEVYMHPEPI